jgi:hypothetical protein
MVSSHRQNIFFHKKFNKKKLGSSQKVIFYSNKLTHKIKTVFIPNSIHNSLTMALSLIIKKNSNIFTYLDRA